MQFFCDTINIHQYLPCDDDDDDVYLIENYNMAVGYKIHLHKDQPRRHRTVPYGTSSGSDNFQNNQNSDFRNSRSNKTIKITDLEFRGSEFLLFWKLSEPELVP
jgi:hypothetical protein